MTQDGQRLQCQRQRCVAWRTAPLEEMDGESLCRAFELQAQGSRGGRTRGLGRAHQAEQGFTRLGGKMQPAQLVTTHAGVPEQQGAAGAGTQDLLGGPASVGWLLRTQPEQLLRRQSPASEGGGVRQVGWCEEDDWPAGGREQGGTQQAHLAKPWTRRQQLDQLPHGPALARQFRRQRRIAGVESACAAPRQLGGAPQRRMQRFGGG